MNVPKGMIFDLDGVITDTSDLHFLAWKRLAEQLDIEMDESFNEKLRGIGRMEALERILELKPTLVLSEEEKKALADQKNEQYKALVSQMTKEDVSPGIIEIITTAREHGIKIGLASASKNAFMVLEKLRLTHDFDYIVDANYIMNGKPDPEIFVTAANELNLPCEECIGIEDASAGIEAINQAGMFSVGIGSKTYLSEADVVYEDTSKLDFKNVIEKYKRYKGA